MGTNFGNLAKELRIASGQTLRSFCAENNFDPGNISKIERGRALPPDSDEKLATYAQALGLSKGTTNWQNFFDQAYAAKGKIPTDLLDDDEVLDKLPVLFRTLRGLRADGDALDDLIDKIRRA